MSAERNQQEMTPMDTLLLQRSRTRVSAESQSFQSEVDYQDVASTEPHSCECGELLDL